MNNEPRSFLRGMREPLLSATIVALMFLSCFSFHYSLIVMGGSLTVHAVSINRDLCSRGLSEG